MLEKEQGKDPTLQESKLAELQAKIDDLQRALHDMPKGYPLNHMYKYPIVDAVKCQTYVDSKEYKGSIEKYLADNAHFGDAA